MIIVTLITMIIACSIFFLGNTYKNKKEEFHYLQNHAARILVDRYTGNENVVIPRNNWADIIVSRHPKAEFLYLQSAYPSLSGVTMLDFYIFEKKKWFVVRVLVKGKNESHCEFDLVADHVPDWLDDRKKPIE
jgi:hypothetical protein